MTKIIQLVGALLGTLLGFGLGLLILSQPGNPIALPNRPAFLMAMVAATLLFGYLAIPYVTVRPARWAVDRLAAAGAGEFALGVGAIVVGLLMGVLVGLPLLWIGGWAGSVLPPVVAVVLALGLLWATIYKRDVLVPAFAGILPGTRRRGAFSTILIDTSSVIDGRIVDVGRTGFILGTLIVPRFVLDELQRIADSPDAIRRNRGRRGLEMLSALQKDSISPVEVSEETYPEITEVDAKLVAFARDRGAAHPDQRLQPQPRRRAAGDPGPQHQRAGERGQGGRASRRGDERQDHPGGQGAGTRGGLSGRRDDDRGRERKPIHEPRGRRHRHSGAADGCRTHDLRAAARRATC